MIDDLHVLIPQDVPHAGIQNDSLKRSGDAACGALLLDGGRWASYDLAERAVADVLADLPDGERGFAMTLREDEAFHDRFFHVARVHGDPAAIFLRSVVKSNHLLLRDLTQSPSTVDAETLHRIDDAFAALQCWSFGRPFLSERRVVSWGSASGPRRSMDRWIRGHQIFAVLTQGLIAAFSALRTAIEACDDVALDRAIAFTVLVLHGAGASLAFTGDLPAEDYNEIVRPAMQPPNVPETFSGLFAVDHRRFVAMLRDMAPWLEELGAVRPAGHAAIAEGLGSVYDGHKFVCERLVGRSPSLMMMSGVTKKSGADQIEIFKKRRMRAFETRRPRATTTATITTTTTTGTAK